MPSKSPKAAVDAALDRLRRTAACVTERPLIATGYRPAHQPHYFGFAPSGQPVPLRARDGRRAPSLLMVLEYAIERVERDQGPFDVRLTYYSFELLDHLGREILAYHWHPAGVSPITYPHLHLSGRLPPLDLGPNLQPAALGDMHLPTGRVTLADVVRLLITEFAVVPRRPDWAAVLDAASAE